MGLFNRAKEVDDNAASEGEKSAIRHYRSVYGPTSCQDHSDPYSVLWYFNEEDIRIGRVEVGPRVDDVVLILPTAYIYCMTILKYLDDSLNIGFGPRIDDLYVAMKTWWDAQRIS